MVILTLDDDQVLALVRQLPEERKNWLLRALVSDQWPRWAELADYRTARACGSRSTQSRLGPDV